MFGRAAKRRSLRPFIVLLVACAMVYAVGRQQGLQVATTAVARLAGGGAGGARRVAAETTAQHALHANTADANADGSESSSSGSSSTGGAADGAGSDAVSDVGSTASSADCAVQQAQQQQADFNFDPTEHLRGVEAARDTPPPLRREGFQPVANDNQAKYDAQWTGKGSYTKNSCWGCRFVGDLATKLDFHTVLDAGTGNGGSVRAMRLRGKAAWGVELSQAVLDRDAPDLLAAGYVEQGSLTNLPYQDSQFDLVFSADVLEHIRPEEVDVVVSELVRVAKRHIVMSISLKSYQNAGLHTLLRPRQWWEAKFAQHGATPNRPVVWALQQKETRFLRTEYSKCKMEGNQTEGGLYEVCNVKMPWLVGRPGQELRQYRCITPANAELEPWMFAFTVE